ncbi:alpha/beta hydrolase [Bradyrhizobium sp. SZCCHNS2096]|uniref:alpha/beta fold hydrolase n=1 Tax=Bradyrhizobium sp. SZCCHNS2096 TaxID=3057309 RepID=UPI0029165A12|nr:alpha/beta hydrolase [Bradyrhizobium sp. SZCCHNS2096]
MLRRLSSSPFCHVRGAGEIRMPFATHRGQRLHYTVDGAGPLVVLQHGLLLDGASWRRCGIVDVLAQDFRVVCVDSLGHGRSDKPADPALYAQDQRAGDIVAVIDDLGCERAHVIGHSMGGWLAVGVAKDYASRLSSLVVAGWNLMSGLAPGTNGPVTFDGFMKFARATAPKLTEWVTSEHEAGVRACFEALYELEGAEQAVLGLTQPVMLWNGRHDPAHDPMQAFAKAHGLHDLSTEGDHLGMLFRHGAEGARGLRAFLHQTSSD